MRIAPDRMELREKHPLSASRCLCLSGAVQRERYGRRERRAYRAQEAAWRSTISRVRRRIPPDPGCFFVVIPIYHHFTHSSVQNLQLCQPYGGQIRRFFDHIVNFSEKYPFGGQIFFVEYAIMIMSPEKGI